MKTAWHHGCGHRGRTSLKRQRNLQVIPGPPLLQRECSWEHCGAPLVWETWESLSVSWKEMSELSVFHQREGCRLSPHCENTRRKCLIYLYKGRKNPAVILIRKISGWMLDHTSGSLPVVGANGIQNILDTILPLHPLLGFVNHGWQVLQMGFTRKKGHVCHLPSGWHLEMPRQYEKVASYKCIHF